MSIYQLKTKFQNLLRPICSHLVAKGCTPNMVTCAAIVLSATHGMLIYFHPGKAWLLGLLPLTLFIRMALNALDGMMAREHNMKTKAGALLNEMGDVLSDTVLYAPFIMIPFFPAAGVALFILLSILSEFAGVLGVMVGSERRYDGPMGKSDRAFVFGAMALFSSLGLLSETVLCWIFILLNILLMVTIGNRLRKSLITS